jgi:hypothetical protein
MTFRRQTQILVLSFLVAANGAPAAQKPVPAVAGRPDRQEKARPASLAWSDPANVLPAPAWAVGQADRTPDLDVLPGFQKPPRGFGVVPFYWWLGDPLTKERLAWELDQVSGMGICGLQINYAHTDRGGRSYGLTMPSDPPLFSEEWWKLVGWFLGEAKRRGIAVSLSDYTLGIGQGWRVDQMLREHPELTGEQLRLVTGSAPADALASADVREPGGKPRRVSICAVKVPYSLDPMNPLSGPEYARRFFGQFEDHFPGEGGRGLNFFFSDELSFGVAGRLWNNRLAEEFENRKGYDIVPELPALFVDMGPRTPKVRLDYSDVMIALSEEGFFKPVFDWHQRRGMTMGCDHGGRGRDVVEFGDYFRTQRWMQGPGADQPRLGKDLIKAKVASSIAHLYVRPRVWLEGYYGSGWGTTPAGVVDATFADFVMGYNLLAFHGMYYSTHGGWWEWAPPDNTFRMPYWKHMRGFMQCVQRLAYLFSQGHHRCDVAILYPVAPMEAGMGGKEAVQTAFDTASRIYAMGIDFDFMDFESLARAQVVGRELHVSGEVYRVLVLPAMKAVRYSTMQKALEFHRAGGAVLAVGALPEASERIGRDDPELAAMVKEVFPKGPATDVATMVRDRDFERADSPAGGKQGAGYVMHRKIGPRDLYALYGMPQATVCKFRVTGKAEWWDPWTGQVHPLPVISQTGGFTELELPLGEKEIQLIVFSAGAAVRRRAEAVIKTTTVDLGGDWEFELKPMLDNRFGDYHWPPTPPLIGAEVRQMDYTEGDPAAGPWHKVTCSFGPQFWKLGPVERAADEGLLKPDTSWKPYEFSWRWGIEGDPGHQGYHGLKAEVHDEFIAIGKMRLTGTGTAYEREGNGRYYLWTAVLAPREMTAYALTGAFKPAKIWLNGDAAAGGAVHLKAGVNFLLLRYDQVGRTFFVVSTKPPVREELPLDVGQPQFRISPLAMSWWKNPAVLPFDARPEDKAPVGWYRFTSPPGLRAMTVSALGKVKAWVNGREVVADGAKFVIAEPPAPPAMVLLRIEQERGCYGGAALPEPIRLECVPGKITLGDWSKIDGLRSYSGGAWYRKSVTIPPARRIVLDLGNVAASAEVRVNGRSVGERVSPPWRFDITETAKPGKNRIEILVCNTLANHYTTIPSRYRGDLASGLLGPVTLQLDSE